MMDANLLITLAGSGLIGLGMVTAAGLAGWRGWLQLRAQELSAGRREPQPDGVPNAGARIEIADLKERIRKLEAIAAGVDL
jgi:hypothetical protein